MILILAENKIISSSWFNFYIFFWFKLNFEFCFKKSFLFFCLSNFSFHFLEDVFRIRVSTPPGIDSITLNSPLQRFDLPICAVILNLLIFSENPQIFTKIHPHLSSHHI